MLECCVLKDVTRDQDMKLLLLLPLLLLLLLLTCIARDEVQQVVTGK
jgi:hypothetical protein